MTESFASAIAPVVPSRNGANAHGPIVLFSPEHFYLFNTLAVPQLTGYLRERGYPVQQRVLDNEFYSFVSRTPVLRQALADLEERKTRLEPEFVAHLAESVALGRLPEELGFRAADPARAVTGMLRHSEAVIRMLHKAEALLRREYLGLSKNRFLLALARLQLAVDLFVAPFWPSKFGVLGGLETVGGSDRSAVVLGMTADEAHNPLLAYYRSEVVPPVAENAVLAGVSITHEAQILPAFTLARVIREQRPDLHIVLGGATVSTLRETLSRDNALSSLYDSLVIGAGEPALTRLYDALAGGSGALGDVPNLVWRGADGMMRRNPDDRSFTIDQVATPVFTDPRPHPIVTVASSTGCDWARCRFCHFPRILSDESSYCCRPADHFLRDVKRLQERHDPFYIHLCDTNLSVGQLEALTEALLDEEIEARFYAFVRAEKAFTDPAFCRRIRKAGFFALHFGLESGSQEVLNRAHKGIDLSHVPAVITTMHAADIIVSVFLMVGLPGESPADVDKTVTFMKENLGSIRGEIAMCRYYLDLYSDVYEYPERYGVEILEDHGADLGASVPFRNPGGYNPEDMEALVDDFYTRVGLPRSYGERLFFEMLDRFCPSSAWQSLRLYAPFLRGYTRRAFGMLGGE